MSKVVGFEGKTFTFDDGNTVKGFYLHLEEKTVSVTGIAVERVFVSDKKLAGYNPVLGDDIIVSYNRFGKPQSIIKR